MAEINDPLSQLERSIVERIVEPDWLALSTELIATGQPAAENPLDPDMPAGREEAIALLVAGKLEAMGFRVEKHVLEEGRPNVVGVLEGSDPAAPSLILNDHLDTYPAGDPAKWTMTGGHPFRAARHGDKLYARGTSDTRANLACTLLAVRALRNLGVRLKGTLKCVYTVDEEKNGAKGALYLLNGVGLKGDYEITCEPTGWTDANGRWGVAVSVANCGHCLLDLTVHGVKSHIWRPDTGVNAILKTTRLLARLETMRFRHAPPQRYGGTPPMVAVVRIGGGVPREMQFTPDECRAVLAVVGLVPGMTLESIVADIEAEIAAEAKSDPDLRAEVRQYPGSLFVAATQELSPEAEPAASLRRAYRKLRGEEPVIYRKNAYNDTIRFAEAGIPSVTFGPGEDGWPPVNEYIGVEKSIAATRMLALAVMDILGVAS